jgi:hypothetical protein
MKLKIFYLVILQVHVASLLAQTPLLIPDTLLGTSLELTLQNGTFSFFSGQNTTTMGVNGNILGPTLIIKKDDFVDIAVNNQLDEITTIHWHGMHVSASNDGGPHTTIAPLEIWNPQFTILDKAGTYWYHPHLHEDKGMMLQFEVVESITGSRDEEMNSGVINVYPNPVTESNTRLTISGFISDKVHFELYNMQGQKILEQKIMKTTEALTINLPGNLHGTYLLKMNGDKITHTKKIIIK